MFGDGSAARRYHLATNQSLESVRGDPFRPIAQLKPRPYKLYVGVDSVPLGDIAPDSTLHALDAISSTGLPAGRGRPLTTSVLAALLHYSAGIIQTTSYFGQVMKFRAAACAGALYHIDVYLVTGALNELEAGVYQFGPQDGLLHRLRFGDFRTALVDACANEQQCSRAEAMLVFTTTFWRSSWKYRARAYRHAFWDSGTMLANTLAVARAHNISAAVVLGFNDSAVNRLLDVNAEREAAIAVVALGGSSAPALPAPPIRPIQLPTVPYSVYEETEPLIVETHRAACLHDKDQVLIWRNLAESTADCDYSDPLDDGTGEPIERVIRRRGSAHDFQRTPISFEELDAILYASSRGIRSDVIGGADVHKTSFYLIVNAVAGLEPGAYVYEPITHTLEALRLGDFRADAGYLDLAQRLGADAAVNIYLFTDLDRVLSTLGERGYRVAQLEAGIIGGRLYLASYALGLDATGATFFDDDVVQFFSPHAAGKDVMFLMAVGHRAQLEFVPEFPPNVSQGG
jgi:SagB-type dehydrogenase family enzyme